MSNDSLYLLHTFQEIPLVKLWLVQVLRKEAETRGRAQGTEGWEGEGRKKVEKGSKEVKNEGKGRYWGMEEGDGEERRMG